MAARLFPVQLVRKNGTRYWAGVVLTALHDKSGKLRDYIKVTWDISERREAQEALRLSERNLAQFINESPCGLFWVAPTGEILRVNQAGQASPGLDLGDRIRQRIQIGVVRYRYRLMLAVSDNGVGLPAKPQESERRQHNFLCDS